MKDLKIKKKSKTLEFITGKGFYLSLAISLTLIGTTIWFAMNKSIDKVIDKNIGLMQNSISEENLKSVDNIVKNVPINKEENISNNNKTPIDKKSDIKDNKNKPIEKGNEFSPSTSGQNADNSILFVPPLLGEIANHFSNNELVKDKTLSDWRTHNGVDIKAPQGTKVKAIADGEVIKLYNNPMLGVCIEIEHPGNINSIYCGLNKDVTIKEGDKVEAGDVIGSVGETAIGESELGPHLHLEIKEKGVKIDPLSKIKIS